MTWEADGVLSVTLADPGGAALPRWAPGAHVDLIAEGVPTRQYSLCGDPADPFLWRVAVLREEDSRGGSAFVHETLRPGALVGFSGPRNNFPLVPADGYLFVAGGIGITPLLPMARAAAAAGVPWHLLYGGRTRASMVFLPELARYGGHVTVRPHDEYGPLDLDEALAGAPGATVYCCGPEPLLAAMEERVPGVRLERFSPRPVTGTAEPGAFQVVLRRSGLSLPVPADRTVLSVLEEAGIRVPTSCLEGVCGSCETTVLEGEVEHRDSVLTEAERAAGDTMFICVSRCRSSRLVLDR
ncbi:ferredoxin-NADP reductase [Streptosporangium becharense]|uniref:Ferredoxin-NADP reductase n=1 Tax=Streptosporangium becharense TaxID=1816182 RepID=A0A7W9IMS6_9ACTN|nr:PDR/VanB family oxidoreductase [Streptosporangium becharense]MBB2910492.1 ferredoxin-NADP reductase [Streptosporangium becharense]MBB5823235.1 ferredoxin-NADP reductase [Streptosporangium becharense]